MNFFTTLSEKLGFKPKENDEEREEDEHEANDETHREQLPIEQDAEHHAEHRLKTQDERGLRGLDVRKRYILHAEREDGRE